MRKLVILVGLGFVVGNVLAKSGEEIQFIHFDNMTIPVGSPYHICRSKEIPQGEILQEATASDEKAQDKARILIVTDLGGSDEDDTQSFAHILSFAERFDIEGILTAMTPGQGSYDIRAIKDIIDYYKYDVSTMLDLYGFDVPDADVLEEIVYAGARENYDIDEAMSYQSANKAVQTIIMRARCGYHVDNDRRPLYILGWGGQMDIAQALAMAPDIRRVVRLVTFSRSNADVSPEAHEWLLQNRDTLWWVDYADGSETQPLDSCLTHQASEYAQQLWRYRLSHYDLIKAVSLNTQPGCENKERNVIAGKPSYFKFGDTITTTFLLYNTAQQRNAPETAEFGDYEKYEQYNYWVLKDEPYNQINFVYQDWLARAKLLNQRLLIEYDDE